MDLAPLDCLMPVGCIEFVKKKAKLMQKRLSTGELKVKLSLAQNATARCLGYSNFYQFQASVKRAELATCNYDIGLAKSRQRFREIQVLSELLPHLPRNVIEDFVDSWRLVDWAFVENTRISSVAKTSLSSHGQPIDTTVANRLVRTSETYRPADVDMSSWCVEETDDVFMPPSVSFASEKAEALPQILLTVTRDIAYALLARIYGFESWADLEDRFRYASRAKFDDEVDRETLRRRMARQCRVLQSCLRLSKADAVELRLDWRPTSQSLDFRSAISRESVTESAAPAERRPRVRGRLTLHRKIDL